jgi:hypothetical protein
MHIKQFNFHTQILMIRDLILPNNDVNTYSVFERPIRHKVYTHFVLQTNENSQR